MLRTIENEITGIIIYRLNALESYLIALIILKNCKLILLKNQGRRWCIEDQFQTTSAKINAVTVYVKDVVTYTVGGGGGRFVTEK